MKLTKQDIDKVRHIEGFPIAKDEDIISLSRPPYYTACPNPFIEDFIREHGTPYDEATDDYHREPFAADVSEGKNDPIYNAHSYHTKVPYKAIMRYILHYTKPGDVIFDGFCGTGMTGVAAQMCGSPDPAFKAQLEKEMMDSDVQWGARKAILNDLSPAATFIAYNYNTPVDVNVYEKEAKRILVECEKELGWMYETQHVDAKGNRVLGLDGKPVMGRINYTVWSDVFICPSCSNEIIYWNEAVDKKKKAISNQFSCPKCGAKLTKTACERAYVSFMNQVTQTVMKQAKQVPVMVKYKYYGKMYEKPLDTYDHTKLRKIDEANIESWFPTTELKEGEKTRDPVKMGISSVDLFYTKRNLNVLSSIWEKASKSIFENQIKWLVTSILIKTASKLHNIGFKNGSLNLAGAMPNALYIPSIVAERNIFLLLDGKLRDVLPVFRQTKGTNTIVTCSSTTDVSLIPDNCIDYIFTDPPFGSNLNYSELSFIWEAWLRVITNDNQEAIISPVQKKGLSEYQALMEKCFGEYYRALKPKHWITIEFHNSKNSVWNAIQEALMRVGFIVADVRTIDKGQGSYNQMTSAGAVQQDLVISAYKPSDSFVRNFQQRAGDPEVAWDFVRQHLEKVPITADGNKDGVLDLISERCDYLLFDRMIAYHIMHGISVPMDAHTFYEGLRQRFLEREGMFFLPDQVTAFDEKRMHMKLDTTQFSFVVTDEKNAIQWLNYILKEKPQTYSDIYPQFTRELQQDKREKMPELLEMLKDSFLQDEQGRFYIPDLSKSADLAKLRIKKLLKEFYDSYVPGKAKLKALRMEAIRAGFDDCWNKRDYKTIIGVGERLPENVLQEDPALLMYYDNACVRG